MFRRAAKQIAVCAIGLIILCAICRHLLVRQYNVYVPLPESVQNDPGNPPRIDMGQPGVAHMGEMTVHDGYLSVPVFPDAPGETQIRVYDENGKVVIDHPLRVNHLHTVYDPQTNGYSGETIALIGVTVFWLTVSAIALWHYRLARGPAYYAYSTIYFAGFALYALVTGMVMLEVTVRHIADPAHFSMLSGYSAINSASMRFMMITMPVIVLFAGVMAFSNLELLRREGIRPQNMLGLLVSILLLGGEALGFYLFSQHTDAPGWQGNVRDALHNTYASVFAYFECMLAGSAVCSVKAARYQPTPDKDFIVILGCWFRRDGTLPPLLRGRVDRAISFWHKQKAETGKEAVFIPSGGQGEDEPMPEAEAMSRYLVSQRIPSSRILLEDRSVNTYQNMAFSKKIIDGIKPDGKTVFATTNYHVFRSGIWAAQAGLPAEGIGGRTSWWFWPNAFMRECAGLMLKRWKQELLLLALTLIFFGMLSVVLG